METTTDYLYRVSRKTPTSRYSTPAGYNPWYIFFELVSDDPQDALNWLCWKLQIGGDEISDRLRKRIGRDIAQNASHTATFRLGTHGWFELARYTV